MMLPLFLVFCLGVVNFAAHRAILERMHAMLAQVPRMLRPLGGWLTLLVEFVMLVGAMVMAASGSLGWAAIYALYTVMTLAAAWAMASGGA